MKPRPETCCRNPAITSETLSVILLYAIMRLRQQCCHDSIFSSLTLHSVSESSCTCPCAVRCDVMLLHLSQIKLQYYKTRLNRITTLMYIVTRCLSAEYKIRLLYAWSILHCTTLYCTVLYCAILSCTVLYTVLRCTVLRDTVLSSIAVYYPALHCVESLTVFGR